MSASAGRHLSGGAGDDWHSCSVAAGQVDCRLGLSEPTIAAVTALDVIAS
jgi:hypothetical protein